MSDALTREWQAAILELLTDCNEKRTDGYEFDLWERLRADANAIREAEAKARGDEPEESP